jgi:hypothetical protein
MMCACVGAALVGDEGEGVHGETRWTHEMMYGRTSRGEEVAGGDQE